MEITNNERPMYGALPYDMIVDKWSEVYYNGSQPTAADSSTRTYELAMALRNIANNDANLLMKIINRSIFGLLIARNKRSIANSAACTSATPLSAQTVGVNSSRDP